MTRAARVVMPHVAHHITQRGIRKSDVFLDDLDRQEYLNLFLENSRRFLLRILAYCLMTNHVHFVAIPERKDSLWKTFHRCHSVYATRFNKKYGFSGHLWQNRPFSCVLDEDHLWAALRYVELNPVRAKMVVRAEEYLWSSARAHCGAYADPLIDGEWPPLKFVDNWKLWLRDSDNEDMNRRIRERTFTGQPCGDDDFMRTVGQRLGRNLGRKKPGPKPRRPDNDGLLWTPDQA